MTDKNLPSVEYLRKRLRYEPETGKLFWLDCEDMPQRWRTRWAGKEAFTAIGNHGYKTGSVNWKDFLAHRVAFAIFNGFWPKLCVDHINGIRSDNRIENLKEASMQDNARNSCMRKDNTSGVRGVTWNKKEGKWSVTINFDGKQRWVGNFMVLEDAKCARMNAAYENGYTSRHGT